MATQPGQVVPIIRRITLVQTHLIKRIHIRALHTLITFQALTLIYQVPIDTVFALCRCVALLTRNLTLVALTCLAVWVLCGVAGGLALAVRA